jgi:hypothetical protein
VIRQLVVDVNFDVVRSNLFAASSIEHADGDFLLRVALTGHTRNREAQSKQAQTTPLKFHVTSSA